MISGTLDNLHISKREEMAQAAEYSRHKAKVDNIKLKIADLPHQGEVVATKTYNRQPLKAGNT